MTAPKSDALLTTEFLGIVNTLDPLQAPKGALLVADNIDIDDSAAIRRRDGYTTATTFTDVYSVYATEDQKHLYVIDDGNLLSVEVDYSTTILGTGFGKGDYEWEEVGSKLYFLGPTQGLLENGILKSWGVPDGLLPSTTVLTGSLAAGSYQVTSTFVNEHGEEGAAPPALVKELPGDSALLIDVPLKTGYDTVLYASSNNGETLYKIARTTQATFLFDGPMENLVLPLAREQYQRSQVPATASKLAYLDGRMYVADYSQSQNVTYIFHSEPFWLGLFDLFSKYEAVPGQVNLLEEYSSGLLIGTDSEIYTYSIESGLSLLADYGVPKGTQASTDPNGIVYFWTNRGLCRVPEFTNLTQERVSVPPGSKCTTAFIEQQGYNRVVISTTDSGLTNNKYT